MEKRNMNFFSKIQNISRELLQKTYKESVQELNKKQFILEEKATIKFEKRHISKIKRNLMKVASRGCRYYTFSIHEYPIRLPDVKIVEVLKKNFPDLKISNKVINDVNFNLYDRMFTISWE
jgi:predicted Rossmann fold nucleotide-binding protein DprA/Smf involved in DNA uptake